MTDLQEGLPKEPITPQKTPIEGMPPVDNVLPETPTNIQDLMVPPATPDLFPESGDNQDVISPVTTDAETPRSHRGRNVLIATGSVAAAAALAAGAWFSTRGSGTPAPSNTPAASAPATPGSSPTPTESPSIAPKPEIIQPVELVPPEDLKQAKADTAEQFNQEPDLIKKKYFSFLVAQATGGKGIQAYAQQFYDKSHSPYDIYPTSVSVNNTAQDASTIAGYNTRIVWSQPTGLDAQKAIIAIIAGGMSSPDYQGLMNLVQPDQPNYVPLNPRQLAGSVHSFAEQILTNSDLQTNAHGDKFRTTTWTATGIDGNGLRQTITGNGLDTFISFTDYEGKTEGSWF